VELPIDATVEQSLPLVRSFAVDLICNIRKASQKPIVLKPVSIHTIPAAANGAAGRPSRLATEPSEKTSLAFASLTQQLFHENNLASFFTSPEFPATISEFS